MQAFRTQKSIVAAGLTGASLLCGLLFYRADIVALVVPFGVALVVGLSLDEPAEVTVRAEVDVDRCLEGDEIVVTVSIAPATSSGVTLRFVPSRWLEIHGEGAAWLDLTEGQERRHLWHLTATRWGIHELGSIEMRAVGRGGVVEYRSVTDLDQQVRVYPSAEAVRRAVRPPRTQVFSGDYPARSAGDGIEFAAVQPFSWGHATRRVNWRVSSRRLDLYMNVSHPERNADVVLFLDAFDDVGLPGGSSLDKTVRGAAALARHYLAHRDRVGLVSFGGMLSWLTGSMEGKHVYRIVEHLLDVRVTFSYAWKDLETIPPRTLPPSSLVVALTPLVDMRVLGALIDLRARGFAVIVIDTLPYEDVSARGGQEADLAFRCWKLHRGAVAYELERQGVPVVRWSGHEPLEGLLARIPRLRRFTARTG